MVSHDVQALDYATHILHMQKKNSFYGTKEEYMNSDKWKLFKNAEEKYLMFFSKSGFTESVKERAARENAVLLTIEDLY